MSLVPYDGSLPSIVPEWSDRWEGRLLKELDDLARFAGGSLRIDMEYLEKGILRVTFSWPLRDDTSIDLAAIYPESFPYLRPHVVIIGDPKTFPKRHCAPDGTLCLLGRDTGLWSGTITLANLLDTNLSKIIFGSEDEDPQGEPVEVWWNSNAATLRNGSLLLTDSNWSVAGHKEGFAEIEYSWRYENKQPYLCAAISKIWLEKPHGTLLEERRFSLPPQIGTRKRTTIVKWRRDDTLLPPSGRQSDADLIDRIWFNDKAISEEGARFYVSLTVQRSELQQGQFADSWICAIEYIPHSDRYRRLSARKISSIRAVVPTYRAGQIDLGFRVPAVKILRDANIALFGLGALGAPLAIDLARNGCRSLTIVDHDIIEPGNTVRWALGASSWGKAKVKALAEYIGAEYLETQLTSIELFVGKSPHLSDHNSESEIIDDIVGKADVVLDAMASTGVTRLLSDACRRHGKALLSLAATVSLKGGTVTFYHPASGCPVCSHNEHLQRAAGAEDDSDFRQPLGCAERTFSGASYDLQELTLEAMRMTIDFLSNRDTYQDSLVHTLTLHDGSKRVPPKWQIDRVPLMKECGCQK